MAVSASSYSCERLALADGCMRTSNEHLSVTLASVFITTCTILVFCVCCESHFYKAPLLREAYLLTLPHGEDEDGVGGADRGSLAHVVPQGAI